jgi:SAM-dependent methyltransferase
VTQNIYDDPGFFAGYSRLRRSVEGPAGAPEWPALRALLPDLGGLRVVDLGCGFGWFCRWAREQGAAEVLGLDVSEKMLARAGTMTSDPAITYARVDLESLTLPPPSFDVAHSSLVLHYVENLSALMATVHRALVPGAHLVLSAEHPIFTAPERPGWSVGTDGRKIWPVDRYLVEGPRRTDWLGSGVIKQHRTIGTYLNLLIDVGFVISHVTEWRPTPDQIVALPALAEELERPMFLMVAARRP